MSVNFVPNDTALSTAPWNITFLSLRDVAAQVPINFVTSPVVSLSAACFSHNRYEAGALVKCISNLLAAGFTKLIADIYWDGDRKIWTFCPTQIPQTTATGPQPVTTLPLDPSIFPTSSGSPATETLYALGPYTCSSADTLTLLVQLLYDFLKDSDFTLAASLNYFVFNIHAATSSADPLAPAPMPSLDHLPANAQLIGNIFNSNLTAYLYTPNSLAAERADLLTQWNSTYVTSLENPDEFYYTVNRAPDGAASSPDGWPGESYLVLRDRKRLLVGTGSVDPQMQSYNFALDQGIVFTDDILDKFVNVTIEPNGTVANGCLFHSDVHRVTDVNSSFAVLDQSNDPRSYLGSSNIDSQVTRQTIYNLTSCGISPYLNTSLNNVTADVDVGPYQQFAFDAVWSWAPGEPRNDSDISSSPLPTGLPGEDSSHEPTDFRCAVLDANNSGRWYVTFCEEQLPVACRDPNNPFEWTISNTSAYVDAHLHCPENGTFGVPRTSLENRYLYEAARDYRQQNSSAGPYIWLDYNSRSAESCWVAGANTSCPYMVQSQQDDASIIVPTIAAILIILVALATLLVKCGANRSNSRKRRKFYEGWDYEGVPS